MDLIIEIYRKKAQSMKMSCSEIICNLKSAVNISCSEDLMNYSSTHKHATKFCNILNTFRHLIYYLSFLPNSVFNYIPLHLYSIKSIPIQFYDNHTLI